MKKFLTLFLALAAMLTVFAVAVSADETTLTDYTVFLDGKTNTTLYTSAEAEGVVTYTSAGATLKAAIEDSATFKSLDTKIATVDENGKVTPVKTGEVEIRVWNEDGDKLGDYVVHVINRKVIGIKITSPKQKEFYVGDSVPLTNITVKFDYDNGDKEITATTSEYTFSYDEGIADSKDRILVPGKNIKVYVTSTNNNTVSTYFEIDVINNIVDKLVLSIAGGGSQFVEGSVMPGLNVKAIYTDKSEKTIAAGKYSIEITSVSNPKDTDWEAVSSYRLLKTSDKKIRVKYNGVYSDPVTITVTETSSGDNDNTDEETSDYMGIVSGTFKTKSYKVGDKIDWTGMTVTLKNGDTTVATFKSELLIAFSNTTESAFARKFTKDDVKGEGKTNIVLTYEYDGNDYKIPITGLTVTESLGALTVHEIDAVVLKDKSFVTGQVLTLDDIEWVQIATSVSTSKVLTGADLKNYSNAMSLQVLTTTGALKSTRSTTIEASNIIQKDGRDCVNARFYIDSKYFNLTIPVSDPDITLHYDGTLLDTYATIDEVFEAIESLSVSAYPPTNLKPVTITLSSDETAFENLDVSRRIEINLNGNKLTIDSDTIDPDMTASYCMVTVTNTSSTAGTLVYDDEDITVVLKKNESITFTDDYDEEDLLPGVYSLTLDVGDNGTIESEPKADKNGEIIIGHGSELKLVVSPEDGYMIKSFAIGKSKITSSTTGYSEKDGVVTFKFTVNEDFNGDTIKAEFEENDPLANWENPFTDVKSNADYYEAVAFVNVNGLLQGTSATKFSPASTLTRAQFVTILGRLAGMTDELAKELYPATTTKYSDVRKGDSRYAYYSYAVPYIIWATECGLIEGHGGNEKGTFGPEDPITRQQMYVIMKRYSENIEDLSTGAATTSLKYLDKASIADWALDAVKYAEKNDFIVTTGTNTISPTTNAKRSDIAMLLQKYCFNVLGWDEVDDEK